MAVVSQLNTEHPPPAPARSARELTAVRTKTEVLEGLRTTDWRRHSSTQNLAFRSHDRLWVMVDFPKERPTVQSRVPLRDFANRPKGSLVVVVPWLRLKESQFPKAQQAPAQLFGSGQHLVPKVNRSIDRPMRWLFLSGWNQSLEKCSRKAAAGPVRCCEGDARQKRDWGDLGWGLQAACLEAGSAVAAPLLPRPQRGIVPERSRELRVVAAIPLRLPAAGSKDAPRNADTQR